MRSPIKLYKSFSEVFSFLESLGVPFGTSSGRTLASTPLSSTNTQWGSRGKMEGRMVIFWCYDVTSCYMSRKDITSKDYCSCKPHPYQCLGACQRRMGNPSSDNCNFYSVYVWSNRFLKQCRIRQNKFTDGRNAPTLNNAVSLKTYSKFFGFFWREKSLLFLYIENVKAAY